MYQEIETIIQYFQSLHRKAQYPVFPTFDDIQDFIIENIHKDIKDDIIRCIIKSTHGDYFKAFDAKPIEIKRMEVQFNDIENNINSLADKITDVPKQFVFNLDEMGAQKGADTCKKNCYISSRILIKFNSTCCKKKRQTNIINLLHIIIRISGQISIWSS